ncbi:Appr-1-p processing protein [Streptomyces noursei ZPM]|uniref:Appr-1-p processing protein n=1 Tax=Streptomyces noursei TaxID=1971 RepID=A0A401RBB8_STRNR|nr:macro domain-containing protein [Streptomyces noursei]AKA07031.1 Appr-1-p processing protein [Streptomyces noursei ZPM]EOS98610.1 Appr-1-p processing protein [Streptomyces noursei CCRC 11814]EXU91916.1 Appr-1-p processing protein [Streptomyces noursei PD-1]UWS75585.1 macro domain-containing protein [Streptomyces noursei]GCB94908.1 Appr-1-p processing protein [Streptomyces noursei]
MAEKTGIDAAIVYVRGDATAPQGKGVKMIVHVCNDLGGWGRGFVLALSRRWSEPERAYRRWHRERAGNDFGLGAVQFVPVGERVWVANVVGQRGIKTGSRGVPVRYEALAAGLGRVADRALELGASVHMPRIGCGLAGGTWSRVEPLIVQRLVGRGVAVTVYDQ